MLRDASKLILLKTVVAYTFKREVERVKLYDEIDLVYGLCFVFGELQ